MFKSLLENCHHQKEDALRSLWLVTVSQELERCMAVLEAPENLASVDSLCLLPQNPSWFYSGATERTLFHGRWNQTVVCRAENY